MTDYKIILRKVFGYRKVLGFATFLTYETFLPHEAIKAILKNRIHRKRAQLECLSKLVSSNCDRHVSATGVTASVFGFVLVLVERIVLALVLGVGAFFINRAKVLPV